MEVLRSNQLILLVDRLQRFYRELPQSLLPPTHIYIYNKWTVVSGSLRKHAKRSNDIVPNFSAQ